MGHKVLLNDAGDSSCKASRWNLAVADSMTDAAIQLHKAAADLEKHNEMSIYSIVTARSSSLSPMTSSSLVARLVERGRPGQCSTSVRSVQAGRFLEEGLNGTALFQLEDSTSRQVADGMNSSNSPTSIAKLSVLQQVERLWRCLLCCFASCLECCSATFPHRFARKEQADGQHWLGKHCQGLGIQTEDVVKLPLSQHADSLHEAVQNLRIGLQRQPLWPLGLRCSVARFLSLPLLISSGGRRRGRG
mmetsp:Transcript_23071/g.49100  ORF Transcript_23071/g.49100 Transcript_23071/m.49100 type:complete len:247 (+) Transcript_23071:295-1035(+)